jgi:hypothetical protein
VGSAYTPLDTPCFTCRAVSDARAQTALDGAPLTIAA